MKFWYAAFSLLTALALVLPASFGQDKKDAKDLKKEVKKDDVKSDVKKDKDDAKKTDAKEPAPMEEKLVFGVMMKLTKIRSLDANSNKDFAVDVQYLDQKKVFDLNNWKVGQLQHIANAGNNLQERLNRQAAYQRELAQKNVYSTKEFPVRAAEGIKVRTMFPPVEYDDKGNLKKWAKKDLDALRGKTKLPGYPAEYDVLRAGQTVDIYLAKVDAKGIVKGKKVLDDDDIGMGRPEVVMIVVVFEAPPRQ